MEEKKLCLHCGKEIDITAKYACRRKYCKDCSSLVFLEQKKERARRICAEKKAKRQEGKERVKKEEAAIKASLARKKIREIDKKVSPIKSIAQIQREAREHNMSYGKYIEALERGAFT